VKISGKWVVKVSGELVDRSARGDNIQFVVLREKRPALVTLAFYSWSNNAKNHEVKA
jgi:hypothetical protein